MTGSTDDINKEYLQELSDAVGAVAKCFPNFRSTAPPEDALRAVYDAKTFKEKECTRHYCKNSKRSLQVIKFLWLFYLPIVLATSPRHVVVAQVCLLFSASIVLYVAALRTAAKCINALMLTSVSVKLQLHKLT